MLTQKLNASVSVRNDIDIRHWSATKTTKGTLVNLGTDDIEEVRSFLNIRPVHTVVMASFIHDNGIVSELNRGMFYGYRNSEGDLEGVALIGHSTLIES